MTRFLPSTARLTLALIAFAPIVLEAQSAALARYRIGPDTLRYAERTTSRVTMQSPRGEIVVQSVHDAGIGLRGIGDGRAEAWYERLTLQQQGPGQSSVSPSTAALLGQRYVLGVTATGQMQTLSAPVFPAPVAAITELSRQFDDFFVALPAKPLRPGVVWMDTVVRSRGARADSSMRMRHVRSYRVQRDSTINGVPAAVIAVDQVMRLESTAPMQGRLQTRTVLEGEEHGTAVFVPSRGELVSRERRGTMSGQLTISGGSQPAAIPERYEHTSTLKLQTAAR